MEQGKIINFSDACRKEKKFDPAEVEPEDLLPILKRWKAANKESFRLVVKFICSAEGTDPEEIAAKGRRRNDG